MQARQGRGALKFARTGYKILSRIRVPVIRPLYGFAITMVRFCRFVWKLFTKILWREPLFRYRCETVGRGLILEGAVPQFMGDGRIVVGDNCTVGTRNTWDVGFAASERAELIIGDRVSINYQTTISVATQVRIGDDTMIAGNVQIYDNMSHPLSPSRRRRHEPITLDEASPITIGPNVWIGNSAIIMRGVNIGENSVVAAGSIVTRDVPPDTLVAGVPARVIRGIADDPPVRSR